jgi:GAF domain-containing protein
MLLELPGSAGRRPHPRRSTSIANTSTVLTVEAMLNEHEIYQSLGVLNARTAFRFSSICRFDSPILRCVYFYDRTPGALLHHGGAQVLEETYAAIVQRTMRPFFTEDSRLDSRLLRHSARDRVRSYVGAPIRRPARGVWGVIAHFDYEPRRVPPGEAALLLEAGGLFSHWIFADQPADDR